MEFEKVKEIIVDSLSCDEDAVTLEANLKEDLDADSLDAVELIMACLLYTSPSPRDRQKSRMPSSA